MTAFITYTAGASRQDSIAEHGALLAASLRKRSLDARTAGAEVLEDPSLTHEDVIWLQYNPYAYGRWGIAPRLLSSAGGMVRRSRRPRLVLCIHEPFIPLRADESLVPGLWQRHQLRRLVRLSDAVVGVTAKWCAIAERLGAGTAHHVPVGSGLPDGRERRASARERLGAVDDVVVVAQFGTDHPSRLDAHALATIDALRAGEVPFIFLNLGHSARRLTQVGAEEVLPGFLAPGLLAEHLAAADLFLSPCVDGVSTRRTSVMAALQHGVPVIGTVRPETDANLLDATALRLAEVEDVAGFARLALALALDRPDLDRARRAARDLYERAFAWDVVGQKAAEVLEAA